MAEKPTILIIDDEAGHADVLAEALAQEPGEGAGVRVGQVGGGEPGRIQAPGGAEAGEDERHLGLLRGEQELRLGVERIDGVDQDVAGVVGEKLGCGPGVEEGGERDDFGRGVDVAQEAGGGFGLGLAEGGMEGEGVAVEVGGAELVEIDKDEPADGGAGEGFGGGGPDGAEAGADDAGAGQAGEGVRAEEEFEALEGGGHGRQPSMAAEDGGRLGCVARAGRADLWRKAESGIQICNL